MKKNLLLVSILLTANFVFAKKVKFSVNMTGQIINVTGVHVMGDFQAAAGFPGGDWLPNTTTLTQEITNPDIYSIVVDIPAFTKYEYKFVNGDQSYEAEFVPAQSRVDGFNDNRWLWVDSLADDTTDIGAILFAGNAPANLTLLRFKVNANLLPAISPAGIHVTGDFQGWDPAKIMLYSFGSGVYEIISYLPFGTYEFKYYNGNTAGDAETVPLACAVNNSRQINLNTDTVLHDAMEYAVCFSGCATCPTGLDENENVTEITVYPNPAKDQLVVGHWSLVIDAINIFDAMGRIVLSQKPEARSRKPEALDVSSLRPGIYFVRVSDSEARIVTTTKLVIE